MLIFYCKQLNELRVPVEYWNKKFEEIDEKQNNKTQSQNVAKY